jgi:hypothetical protein
LDISHIDDWQEADASIMKQIKAYNALWHIKSRIFKILFYGSENSPKDLLNIQLLMEEHVDPLDIDSLSVRSKFLYHHMQSAFHYAKKDLAASYSHLDQNLKLLNDFGWLFADNPFAEISILSNMSYIGIKLGMKEEIKPIFDKMIKWNNHLDQADENLKVRWFYSYYSIYLIKQINSANCDSNDPELSVIIDGFEKFENKIPSLRKADLKMMLSVFYHKAGENRIALKTVHDLLNELSIKQNQSLYFVARFFYLLLLIELNKKDYFEVAWLSTKRLLKNSNYSNSESEVLSDLFDGYLKDDASFSELLKKAEKEFISENSFFDFKEWTQNKRNELNNPVSL